MIQTRARDRNRTEREQEHEHDYEVLEAAGSFGFLNEWKMKQKTAMKMQESATLNAGQGCAKGT